MSKILDFFADNPEVAGSIAKTVPAIMGMFQANKAKNAIEGPGGYQEKLENLERNRQELVNPYATVSNPYANLQVATKAAEIQAEQSDIALANTLDTLRATGASAGGATALARMALESKKGVSASIEQQEANNQKMRASGEERLQGIEMNEAKRVQNTNLSQAEKVQKAEVEGAIYEFETQESRDEQQLNRKQGQIDNASQRMQSANAAKGAAIGGGISAVGNIFGNPAAYKG